MYACFVDFKAQVFVRQQKWRVDDHPRNLHFGMKSCIPASFDAPPEGGWGWVVVFASWAAHVIVLGLQYSFGVLYRALLEESTFSGGDRGATSWIGSIAVAVMLAAGVVVGHATQKYGHRTVALAGSFFVPLGLLTSSFVPTMAYLYLTYGLITGIGFACSFAPSVMIISRYFVKRRALATGIAVSGSGVGTLLFAAVSDTLIQRTGWRGTLQVFALVSLIVLALAAVTYVPVASSPAPLRSQAPATPTTLPVTVAVAGGKVHEGVQHGPGPSEHAQQEPELLSPPLSSSVSQSNGTHASATPSVVQAVNPMQGHAGVPAAAPAAPAQTHQHHPKLTMAQVWCHTAFMPVGAVLFVYGGGLFSVYGHLVVAAGATDGGLSNDVAARLVSWVGLAGMAGRVIFGQIQDNKKVDRVLLLWVTLSIAGLSVIGMAFLGPGSPGWDETRVVPVGLAGGAGGRVSDASAAMPQLTLVSREGLWTFLAVMFGLFSGGVVSQVPPTMVDNLGLDNLPLAQGASYTIQAPAVLLGPPSAGWARAAAGNYFGTLLFVGLAMTISPFCLLYMPSYRTKMKDWWDGETRRHVSTPGGKSEGTDNVAS